MYAIIFFRMSPLTRFVVVCNSCRCVRCFELSFGIFYWVWRTHNEIQNFHKGGQMSADWFPYFVVSLSSSTVWSLIVRRSNKYEYDFLKSKKHKTECCNWQTMTRIILYFVLIHLHNRFKQSNAGFSFLFFLFFVNSVRDKVWLFEWTLLESSTDTTYQDSMCLHSVREPTSGVRQLIHTVWA